MELRSGRRLRLLGGDDDGVDRISGLHDDLLIHVLVRLRCCPHQPASSPAGGAASGGTSPSSPSAASHPALSTPPSPRSPSRSCPSSTSMSLASSATDSPSEASPRCCAPPRVWTLWTSGS
ncbi:unnamed protein product [Urochloa humidicola]